MYIWIRIYFCGSLRNPKGTRLAFDFKLPQNLYDCLGCIRFYKCGGCSSLSHTSSLQTISFVMYVIIVPADV